MLIVEETVELATAAGPMRCLLIRPKAEGKFGGVVFFSEIFQITGPIHRTAAIIAGHGFVVLVPEVYHELLPVGTVLGYTAEDTALGNKCKTDKDLASYDSDAAACVAFLEGYEHCTGKVGAAGTCLGGGLAFRCAVTQGAKVRAAVCFYGTDLHKGLPAVGGISKTGDDTLSRAAAIKGELMMIYGRQDPHIPLEGRRMVYDAILAAGLTFEWHEFNGAHAFLRDESSSGRYDPALAHACYELALGFLHRCLA